MYVTMACDPKTLMFMQACTENDIAKVKDLMEKHKEVKLAGGLRIALMNEYLELLRAILDTGKVSELDITEQIPDIIRKDRSFALEVLKDYIEIKWTETEVLMAIHEFAIGCLLHMLATGSYTDALLQKVMLFAAVRKVYSVTESLLVNKRVIPTKSVMRMVCAESDVATITMFHRYGMLDPRNLSYIKEALTSGNTLVAEELLSLLRMELTLTKNDPDRYIRSALRSIIRTSLDKLVESQRSDSVLVLLKQVYAFRVGAIFETSTHSGVKDILLEHIDSNEALTPLLLEYLRIHRSSMTEKDIQHLERVINQWAQKKFLLKNVVQQYLTTDLIKQLTSM
jgi:hypothetical protein